MIWLRFKSRLLNYYAAKNISLTKFTSLVLSSKHVKKRIVDPNITNYKEKHWEMFFLKGQEHRNLRKTTLPSEAYH